MKNNSPIKERRIIEGCANCDSAIRWGDKVSACCRGRTLGERSAIEIEFYCKKCSANITLQTVTAWRKQYAEEYQYYG